MSTEIDTLFETGKKTSRDFRRERIATAVYAAAVAAAQATRVGELATFSVLAADTLIKELDK
jgi:hypothetical protein